MGLSTMRLMTGKRAETLPELIGPPGPARPATHFIAATPNEVGHHSSQIGAPRR